MCNLFLPQNILFILPYILSVSSGIYIYLRVNFQQLKNYSNVREAYNNVSYNNSYNYIISYVIIVLMITKLVSPNYFFMSTCSNFYKIELLVLSLFVLLILPLSYKNIHWSFGSFFTVIFSLLLLYADDLLVFYFLLEVNTYLFIYLSVCQLNTSTPSQKKSIINSTLMMFIMNFFSSILFFTTLLYLFLTFGSEFFQSPSKYASSFFIVFFMLKVMSGPWVYFGVEVYKGFNYVTLLVYTVLFSLVTSIKMFSYLTLFTINLNLIYPSILMYLFYIFYSIKNVKSFKVFLSYSTSFTFIYLFTFIILIII